MSRLLSLSVGIATVLFFNGATSAATDADSCARLAKLLVPQGTATSSRLASDRELVGNMTNGYAAGHYWTWYMVSAGPKRFLCTRNVSDEFVLHDPATNHARILR